MGEGLSKLAKRRKARQQLAEIMSHPESVIVIHYSSESFYDKPDGASRRITSIAVRNLESGQTTSFSIHQMAELNGVPPGKIEEQYDSLEKRMLDEFYSYVGAHQTHRWMHWNMRDANYGFPAIEHRYRVLGGNPLHLHESKLFDLSRNLFSIYGRGYIAHPRLERLMEKNNISRRDFLAGSEEARAFEGKKYVQLHQSTLRKVDVLASIAELAYDGDLKTDAKWREQYGFSPKVVVEVVKANLLVSSIVGLIALISGILGIISYFKK